MWNLLSNIGYYENLLKRLENDVASNAPENSETEVDFSTLCRSCLRLSSDPGNLLNDFEVGAMQFETDGRTLRMLDLLVPHGITVDPDDDQLPLQICNNCIQIVTNSFFFKMQAQKAQGVLERLLAAMSGMRIEIEEELLPEGVEEVQSGSAIRTDAKVENPESDMETEVIETVEYEVCSDDTMSACLDEENDTHTEKYPKAKRLKKVGQDNDFPCRKCKVSFMYSSDLLDHTKTDHPNDKPFECKICGASFNYLQSLRRHSKKHDDSHTKKTCPFCEKQFIRNDDLTRHIRTHTNERPYPCEVCPKSYKQSSELKQHLLTHLETKMFKCEVCGKELGTRNGIYVHMKIHQNIRHHACESCEKKFVTRGELLSHIKHIHEKSKPFVCPVNGCSRAFISNSSLSTHRRRHHVEEKSLCEDDDLGSNEEAEVLLKMKRKPPVPVEDTELVVSV